MKINFIMTSDGSPIVWYTDIAAPEITIFGANPIDLVVGSSYPYIDPGATAEDNQNAMVSIVQSGTVNSNVIGTYHIVYTATDAAENTASATRVVNIIAGTDSDSDGLSDESEINNHLTDPFNADSDGDGINDGYEIIFGSNPNNFLDATEDIDGDGLSNEAEINAHQTNPYLADSDGDGMPDGSEVTYGFDPNDPFDAELDADNDGISNVDEIRNYNTNPLVADPPITDTGPKLKSKPIPKSKHRNEFYAFRG